MLLRVLLTVMGTVMGTVAFTVKGIQSSNNFTLISSALALLLAAGEYELPTVSNCQNFRFPNLPCEIQILKSKFFQR